MSRGERWSYYSEKLSGERLKLCYELAPAGVRRYLEAEIEFVRRRVGRDDRLLELGCGYGRALGPLAASGAQVVGIDTSVESLDMARGSFRGVANVQLVAMDAVLPAFPSAAFDVVACLQNGLSAFHVDPRLLVSRAVEVTRRGGRVLFSTYAEAFWEDRLAWFRVQSERGLIGEIDDERTGNGVIVCSDGFTATIFSSQELRDLSRGLGTSVTIETVADSSVFCEIVV